MNYIIEHPEWQKPKQRLVIGFVTIGFWMVWFYLWIPFISIIAWLFGWQVFEYHMIELGGYQGLLRLLGIYAIVVLLLGGSLIAWATYNIYRFGSKGKRNPRPRVTCQMQAKHYQLEADQLEKWQESQFVEIHHLGDRHIRGVTVLHDMRGNREPVA